jgi:hypothetical protein
VLFNKIREACSQKINSMGLKSIKTSKGNTQNSEIIFIQKIKDIFDDLKLRQVEFQFQASSFTWWKQKDMVQ